MTGNVDLEIVGFDRTEGAVVDLDRWTDLVRRTLTGEQVGKGRLDVIFVGDEEMAELNATHMGHEGPTDVLSFPLDSGEDDFLANLDGGEGPQAHLGDIVVCPAVAERQAEDHAGTFDAEMTLLLIHGTLHILGHDHAEPEETEAMQGRERIHMEAAGFTHPRWGVTR